MEALDLPLAAPRPVREACEALWRATRGVTFRTDTVANKAYADNGVLVVAPEMLRFLPAFCRPVLAVAGLRFHEDEWRAWSPNGFDGDTGDVAMLAPVRRAGDSRRAAKVARPARVRGVSDVRVCPS